MNVRRYYASLQATIRNCPFITHWNMEFEEIDLQVGYLKGMLEFIDDSTLHFIEFVEIYGDSCVERPKYKYHSAIRGRRSDNKMGQCTAPSRG